MKKTLLLLASLACFVLLVSCKQPQEVIVDQADKIEVDIIGGTATGSGSVFLSGNMGNIDTVTVTADENALATLTVSVGSPNSFETSSAGLEKFKMNTNMKCYILQVPAKKYTQANANTAMSMSVSIMIIKSGDAYYLYNDEDNTSQKLITGMMVNTPEDNSFTLNGVTINAQGQKVVMSSLTFTRS